MNRSKLTATLTQWSVDAHVLSITLWPSLREPYNHVHLNNFKRAPNNKCFLQQ